MLFELVDIVDEGDTRAALLLVERLSHSGADFTSSSRTCWVTCAICTW